MKAMILAAGIGSRLRPLTDNRPKCLLEVQSLTLLEHTIRYLIYHGVDAIIINVHHLAGQVISFLNDHDHFGIDIRISDEQDALLDTGGGLRKAGWFFADGQPFFLTASDVITGLNLREMYAFHNERKALATLAVKDRPTTRNLLFDNEDRLCGWLNNQTGETRWSVRVEAPTDRTATSNRTATGMAIRTAIRIATETAIRTAAGTCQIRTGRPSRRSLIRFIRRRIVSGQL